MVTADFSTFDAGPVRFAYPTNWIATAEEGDEGVSVDLQSQGVSFAIVGVYPESRDPEELVEQTLQTLRQEHPALDAEESLDAEFDKVEMEITFLSMDVVAFCWVRSWRVGTSTVLVFLQSVEREAETARSVFRALCMSLAQRE